MGITSLHSSALSSLRKVFITESARNKLSSSHHALNSLLFALDGYPTATEDPAEIEETARTGTVGGGTGSGRERRDWVSLTGDHPLFPSGRLYFSSNKGNRLCAVNGRTANRYGYLGSLFLLMSGYLCSVFHDWSENKIF